MYLSKKLNKFETSQHYRLGSYAQTVSTNTSNATIRDYAENYPYFFDDRNENQEANQEKPQ